MVYLSLIGPCHVLFLNPENKPLGFGIGNDKNCSWHELPLGFGSQNFYRKAFV